jgi:hypothetical protein
LRSSKQQIVRRSGPHLCGAPDDPHGNIHRCRPSQFDSPTISLEKNLAADQQILDEFTTTPEESHREREAFYTPSPNVTEALAVSFRGSAKTSPWPMLGRPLRWLRSKTSDRASSTIATFSLTRSIAYLTSQLQHLRTPC